MLRRTRAQEKERGGETALGHAETPETMLCRDDGNGGIAESLLPGEDNEEAATHAGEYL
ncbi:hypothetical protein NBRC3257_3186 [Gluconobacter thailandicus NBRC 3257]|uniref:Transposase n=1 Tax=Gluconobacter thailandicus NBRC 3257 TaxID=1381097 RepID=A0ABQ0J163_GLUTH|nr:hypothetical protein NBRC3255_2650 [Gluconobacter thailandicus NBRC 3255]GAD28187.1 hypothetical protein NBRC3257_3186 [Gluconobacter thailandicus NBRC 3257]